MISAPTGQAAPADLPGWLASFKAKPELAMARASEPMVGGQVVRQGDRERESEHADEVHRPDARAHGHGAAASQIWAVEPFALATRAASRRAVWDTTIATRTDSRTRQ